MIVISLTDCPPKVRGDLSKWLCEINTGVFVGTLNARVRDELWGRICENIKYGQATMVYSASGEQKMDFRVHNTTWEPVDFDGIKLMRKPLPRKVEEVAEEELGFSKAAKLEKLKRINAAKQKKQASTDASSGDSYVVLDVETTGLRPAEDRIIEIACLKIENGLEVAHYNVLIKQDTPLPQEITKLTGITDTLLAQEGTECKDALEGFLVFAGKNRIVGHNVAFDYGFLRAECKRNGLKMLLNPTIDTLALAKKNVFAIPDYKLETLAEKFNLDVSGAHRALQDCRITYRLLLKLKEIEQLP